MIKINNQDKIIKGKPVADKINETLIDDVKILKNNGINPKLTIVRVGSRGDDLAYERGALKKCQLIGIDAEVLELDENITQEDYINEIKRLNNDSNVHGILCFRPLPKHLNEDDIKYVISPKKDVDSFSPINTAKVIEGDNEGFTPCTPSAVLEILKYYNINLTGAKVTVLGRSMVVGKPVSILLLNENATVTVCHSKTKDLSNITSDADILVTAVGRAKMIKSEFVKNGAVVVDVGINVDEDGKLCGDVDIDDVLDKVSMITPVPLGVGSVTTTVLAKHVIKACKLQNNC